LAVLVAFIVLIGAVELLAYTAPVVNSFDVDKALTHLGDLYPDELEVNVSNGVISINQELPYSVPLPSGWMSDDALGADVTSLALFTTDDALNGALRERNSLFIIGETIAYAPNKIEYALDGTSNETFTYQVLSIPEDLDSFFITSTDVHGFVTDIKSLPFIANRWFVPAYVLLILVGSIVVFPFIYMFRVVTVFALGFVGWIISIFMSKKLAYMDVVRLSMHAQTPLVIIATIGGLLRVLYMSAGVFILLYIIWFVFVLRAINTVPTHEDV